MSNSKIPFLITQKVVSLTQQLVPKIVDMATQIGIQKLGETSEFIPDVCLINEELQKILNLRNQLIDKLNITYKSINTLSKPLNNLSPILDKTQKGLDIAKTTETAALLALELVPPTIPIPGKVLSGLIKLDKLINITLPPIITSTKNSIASIQYALDFSNSTLLSIINLFKSIDNYLKKCGIDEKNLTPLDENLQKLNIVLNLPQNSNSEIYKGFIIEVIEEQFSPTINKRKAVAKNTQGIILLQTPLSFTTLDDVLINEIKLLIDSNNLKAD